MIVVVDYGAGNLHSVSNSLSALGATYAISRDPEDLRRASKLVLPGVGHFGQMMRALDAGALREPLVERIRAGVPFFGICLGMQALFEGSEEAPEAEGLGVLKGRSLRFPRTARVPHMGWNKLAEQASCRLISGSDWFYFAHSYYVPIVPATSATCEYSVSYSAAIEQDNIFGVQFHPEKSARAGQTLLRKFLDL